MRDEEVFGLLKEINPVPDADSVSASPHSEEGVDGSPIMKTDDRSRISTLQRQPIPAGSRRSGPKTGLVAAVMALVIGLGGWAYLGRDGSRVASTSTGVGEALVAAMDARDVESAVSLLASDAEIAVFGVTTPDDVPALFGWFETVNWRFETQSCISPVPESATCFVSHTNRWSRALGSEPGSGELRMTVVDGRIEHVTYDSFLNGRPVFQAFFRFVRAEHPDDVARMWEQEVYSGVLEPRLDERALMLFDQYSAEFELNAR